MMTQSNSFIFYR